MIVFFWAISILFIGILISEIRLRRLRALKKSNRNFWKKKWTDSIDTDIDVLNIESVKTDFVPTTKIAMRGSWRLAQDMVMDSSDFIELRECEYSKSLR